MQHARCHLYYYLLESSPSTLLPFISSPHPPNPPTPHRAVTSLPQITSFSHLPIFQASQLPSFPLAAGGKKYPPVLPFGNAEAKASAQIRAQLEKEGTPIGPYDILIAGTALANRATLVTHNLEEFKRIEDLNVIDWY